MIGDRTTIELEYWMIIISSLHMSVGEENRERAIAALSLKSLIGGKTWKMLFHNWQENVHAIVVLFFYIYVYSYIKFNLSICLLFSICFYSLHNVLTKYQFVIEYESAITFNQS